MSRLSTIVCLLMLIQWTAACADRTLNRTNAAPLIAGLDEFKKGAVFSFITEQGLTRGAFASDCMSHAEAERQPVGIVLRKLDWVRLEDRPTALGIRGLVQCPALVLTEKGRLASTQWSSRPYVAPGSKVWGVPIGERKLLEVTGLTEAPDGSTLVELNWKWVPNSMGSTLMTSVGDAQKFFEEVRRASASCRRWDDGWRCKLVRMGTGFDDLGTLSID